jgi:hypothetical protein
MRLALALILTIGTAQPLPAHARPSVDATVKTLTRRGLEAYREADFSKALSTFAEALALKSKPSLVLNIAQCYRRLGDRKNAVSYYKRYLMEFARQKPGQKSPYEEEVRTHIERLEREAASVAARPPSTAPTASMMPPSSRSATHRPAGLASATGAARAQSPASMAALALPRRPAPVTALTPPPRPAPVTALTPEVPRGGGGKPLYKRWWFWGLIGAAVVGGSVGVIAATTGGRGRMRFDLSNFASEWEDRR